MLSNNTKKEFNFLMILFILDILVEKMSDYMA